MNKRTPPYMLDSLMVFLNLAGARGNILLFWLFGLSQMVQVFFVVIFIDFFYLIFRFRKTKLLANIGFSSTLAPLYFTILILLVNYYNALREGSGFLLSTGFVLLIVLFSLIMGALIKDYSRSSTKDIVHSISKGYIWLSILTIGGIFLSFILDIMFGLQRTPIEAEFLASNIENGSRYYRSFFSIIRDEGEMRVPFFQKFGTFTGLFHESQSSTHNIIPCLILLLGFSKSMKIRVTIILSGLLFMLFSISVMSILVVALCLCIFFLINSKHRSFGMLIGVSATFTFILLILQMDKSSVLQNFVLDRLDTDNRSQLYSVSMNAWTFSPNTLLGSNFLNTKYVLEIMNIGGAKSDVGYIPFLLLLGYIITFFLNTIKLLSINNKKARAVGFASLYFILHSSKIGMPMLILTLPVLLIYLQHLSLNIYGRTKVSHNFSQSNFVPKQSFQ